jgi:hypothetical protein
MTLLLRFPNLSFVSEKLISVWITYVIRDVSSKRNGSDRQNRTIPP